MHDMLRFATFSGFFENLASHCFRLKVLLNNVLCHFLPELRENRFVCLTSCRQRGYAFLAYVASCVKTRHLDPDLARFATQLATGSGTGSGCPAPGKEASHVRSLDDGSARTVSCPTNPGVSPAALQTVEFFHPY
jgi:hypothetical protein